MDIIGSSGSPIIPESERLLPYLKMGKISTQGREIRVFQIKPNGGSTSNSNSCHSFTLVSSISLACDDAGLVIRQLGARHSTHRHRNNSQVNYPKRGFPPRFG